MCVCIALCFSRFLLYLFQASTIMCDDKKQPTEQYVSSFTVSVGRCFIWGKNRKQTQLNIIESHNIHC